MRTILIVVLTCLASNPLRVFASEPAGGVLMAAAVRDVTQLAASKRHAAQAGTPQQTPSSDGHPVLIGAVIGAGAGAVLGYFGTSCSAPAPDYEFACPGTPNKGGGAVLGAGLGFGIGALIGLVFRH